MHPHLSRCSTQHGKHAGGDIVPGLSASVPAYDAERDLRVVGMAAKYLHHTVPVRNRGICLNHSDQTLHIGSPGKFPIIIKKNLLATITAQGGKNNIMKT